MKNIPSLKDMLESGVHFGHRSSRWHPKMKQFIFGTRRGVHIIDIEQTQKALESALEYIEALASRGGNILFVGTKPQAQNLIEKFAQEAGMPYVNERWLGGTLTNFPEIKKVIKRFLDLKDQKEKGELKKYTKKEQIWIERDIKDMDRKVGGIQTLTQIPEAVFILDLKREKTALQEAKKKGVKVVALVDTNINPDPVDFPIPANDDSVKAIELMLGLITETVKEGRAKQQKEAAPEPKKEEKKAAKLDETKSGNESTEKEVEVKKENVEEVENLDDEIKDELAEEKTKK